MNRLIEQSPLQPCCVCGAQEWTYLFSTGEHMHRLPGTWSIWRCRCTTQITHPAPSDPAEFYLGAYYAYAPPQPPQRLALLRWLYQQHYTPSHLVTRLIYGPGPTPTYRRDGRILDVGCGNGAWLMKMAELGWQVFGVEPGLQAVQAAQAAGLAVEHGTLEVVDFPLSSFDVVRIWHVLEHVSDPMAVLERAYQLLKPGGQLIVGVPNSGGAVARVAGSAWFDLDVPRHLWHWTAPALQVLAERAGFNVETVGHAYYGSYPALRSLMYWYEDRYAPRPTFRHRWQTTLTWLRRQVALAPLHGLFALAEWDNYLELRAIRGSRTSMG